MMNKSARFSDCKKYRYSLCRIWNEKKGLVNFVGLNPSTADENIDDPTIRRCVRFADSWGYGGLIMTNLFAFRATDPAEMRAADDPVGPDNDYFVKELSMIAELTVMSWGASGSFMARDFAVKTFLKNACYLALTKSGQPRHPLYLKKDLKPIPALFYDDQIREELNQQILKKLEGGK